MNERQHTPIQLSVVSPVYQAEEFIEEFYQRMSAAASEITTHYEIILVNDGSTDRSLELLISLHKRDPHIVVIDLSRNFGQSHALRTGLAHAEGDFVFTIDDDLEEQPEWLGRFMLAQEQTGVDVVLAVQKLRKGYFFERFSGDFFYFLMKRVFRVECLPNIITTRLMTRRYVNALLSSAERDFEMSILGHAIGFQRTILTVSKEFRKKSSYSLAKRYRYFEDYLISSSTLLLRWILVGGFLCLGISALTVISSAPLLLSSAWCLGGLILLAMGINGLYVAKILEQVRNRPSAIVRNLWRADATDQPRPATRRVFAPEAGTS